MDTNKFPFPFDIPYDKIIMPEKIKDKLDRKRIEYKNRLEDPSFNEREKIKIYYRIILLDLLFEKGEICTEDCFDLISEKIVLEWRRTPNNFYEAWDIIKDYCETSGKNIEAGTGLR